MKYNNELRKAIKTSAKPMFLHSNMLEEVEKINKDERKIVTKPNKMKVLVWHERWKEIHDRETEFNKYQKTAYLLVIGQCSSALRAQCK